ncbi:hypothetical protein [Paraburkholderia lacunae]|uniref:hypothetical protein n=1 Tax=Paraburkholderia lacunae TaxID=2211104 RepID=UPI001058707F|nr:hypothetical protein [Paraburkholderia lacunae]
MNQVSWGLCPAGGVGKLDASLGCFFAWAAVLVSVCLRRWYLLDFLPSRGFLVVLPAVGSFPVLASLVFLFLIPTALAFP